MNIEGLVRRSPLRLILRSVAKRSVSKGEVFPAVLAKWAPRSGAVPAKI
jgi:hypothetical protein